MTTTAVAMILALTADSCIVPVISHRKIPVSIKTPRSPTSRNLSISLHSSFTTSTKSCHGLCNIGPPRRLQARRYSDLCGPLHAGPQQERESHRVLLHHRCTLSAKVS